MIDRLAFMKSIWPMVEVENYEFGCGYLSAPLFYLPFSCVNEYTFVLFLTMFSYSSSNIEIEFLVTEYINSYL